MKKLNALLLLMGVVFLACLVWKIGVRELGRELELLGWGLAPFIALEFAAEGLHTLAWKYCLSGPYRRLSWIRLFRVRMAGYAINYLTPTAAMGGEVTKAALLLSIHKGPEAIGGVLVGRLCTGISQVLFVMAGSMFILWSVTLPRAVWAAMLMSGALVAGGIVAFLLLQKYGKLGSLLRWLAARRFAGQKLRDLAQEVGKVDEVLKAVYRERPGDLVLAVGWDMVGHSIGLFQTWTFLRLLGQPITAGAVAGIWILGMWLDMLTFAVPLNLGTLEGSRVLAFKAVGYGAVLGITYGFALRLAQLACVVFGLVNYALPFGSQQPTGGYLPMNNRKSDMETDEKIPASD